MAAVTCKYFTFAPVTSGGDGSAMVYAGGKMLNDYLAQVTITENRGNAQEYADGHLIDSETMPTSVTMEMELVNNNADIMDGVLGLTVSTTSGSETELVLKDSDAPFVGAGCVIQNRFKGAISYTAYWLYKTQFTSGGVTAATRRESTEWQHETITGTSVGVSLSTSGDGTSFYAVRTGMATEAAAIAWLKTKAGIST